MTHSVSVGDKKSHCWFAMAFLFGGMFFLHHAAHASHARCWHCGCGVLFFLVGNHTLGGEEHAGDCGRDFASHAGHPGGGGRACGGGGFTHARTGGVGLGGGGRR